MKKHSSQKICISETEKGGDSLSISQENTSKQIFIFGSEFSKMIHMKPRDEVLSIGAKIYQIWNINYRVTFHVSIKEYI